MAITTSSWDPTKIRARAGKLFVVNSPYNLSTPPTGFTTAAQLLKMYLANFYTDGDLQAALVANLNPWANLDVKGFSYEQKYKQVTFDPSVGLPINAGKYLESAIGSCVIGDFSAAKFKDLLSTTSNESLTLAASSTQAAKSGVLIGTTPFNARYMVLYQWPSQDATGTPIPGQFDNLLIPRAILEADIKAEFTKTKPTDVAVKVTAESDLWLVSPDSGMYAAAYFQETTAAHS